MNRFLTPKCMSETLCCCISVGGSTSYALYIGNAKKSLWLPFHLYHQKISIHEKIFDSLDLINEWMTMNDYFYNIIDLRPLTRVSWTPVFTSSQKLILQNVRKIFRFMLKDTKIVYVYKILLYYFFFKLTVKLM